MTNTHVKTRNPEPLVTTAGVVAAAAAVIALLVAFGVELTDAQTEAILGVVAVVAPLVVIVARRWTTPRSRVVEQRDGHEVIAGDGHDSIPPGEKIREIND
ncbi:hypothetical protein [Brachybacterium sp. UMB0905]|uniref:hypothetical protein n=1 Tax=Brachybacterium sp. UMB0905 TaxID=2069310 RepID=UPI000C7FDF29|nr:hypothetical protein [Brachybacterium sp. UMB0905]PMC76766.1 hypothetical protein CJ197_00035 [Brachybacterium sp. UMB0905]